MAISVDLKSKANSSLIESSSSPGQAIVVVSNPDGSDLSGAGGTLLDRGSMNISKDMISKIASAIIESSSTPGQAALAVGTSQGANI